MPIPSGRQRAGALLTTLVLLAVSAALAPAAASADTRPAAGTPATVSADALPTVQVDGVVWSQVVIGTTVYAGGQFANARPAGAAAGQNQTPRSNLLAYDIRTGALVTSFAPELNAQVRGLAASPDGRTLYAVGDFTTVNGTARGHVVALDAATGAVRAGFAPKTNAATYAVAATASTVYVGGTFTSANSSTQARAAAFDATTGALRAWAPSVPDNVVRALVLSPDGGKVVLGGSFTKLNGSSSPGSGLGAVDGATGASVAWNVGKLVYNHGTKSAVFSLASDGTNVYGTGYVYGSLADGNLEGTFNATWADGTVNWVEDCHGDSYSVAPTADAVYVVSHAHYCGNLPGGYPQTDPNGSWHFQRALAYSTATTGTLAADPFGYYNFAGQPAPTQLGWYPDLKSGTVTGQNQGAWSVAAGEGYVVLGGEFPTVNGTAQAGLVRFATAATAPNKEGPRLAGNAWAPRAVSTTAGTARIGWNANWDRDSTELTYSVYRDGGAAPVGTTTASSHGWWDQPTLSFTDTGLEPGSTHTYRVKAADAFGNTATSAVVSVAVAGSAAAQPYASAVLNDGAEHYWRLGDSSGTVLRDTAGTGDLTAGSGVTLGAAGAIRNDADRAAGFNGTANGTSSTALQTQSPNTFTLEAWFRTTSKAGGKIIGFGDARAGASGRHDRHVYLDTAGRVLFGVYPGTAQTLQSAAGFNDGAWHNVTATLSKAGMTLFVDGKQVGARSDVTSGQNFSGFWRVGGDSSWSGASWFTGSIDDVAVYRAPLNAKQVAAHYALGTGSATNTAPTAAFSASADGLTAAFDGGASTDADGSVTGWAWSFGDGTKATGKAVTHAYQQAGTYQVSLEVTDDKGATASLTKGVVVKAANSAPVAAFTSSTDGLDASFDATGSHDDGTIAQYAWDFGDGTSGTGRTATHSYAAAGSYTVRLTVTDDARATGTVSAGATVVTKADPVLAADAFGRTVASGLGTADRGGDWTFPSSAGSWSVASGAGAIVTAPGATRSAYLAGTSADAVDLAVTFVPSALPTGGSSYLGVVGRRVGSSDYNARVLVSATGVVTVQVLKDGTALKSATVAGLTVAPGTAIRLRAVVSGTSPTTLQARAWAASGAEPSAWQVSATDSTPELQAKGAIGLRTYTGGGVTNGPLTTSFDDLTARLP